MSWFYNPVFSIFLPRSLNFCFCRGWGVCFCLKDGPYQQIGPRLGVSSLNILVQEALEARLILYFLGGLVKGIWEKAKGPTWIAYWKAETYTLPTKVRLVKAMVFPVVMYGCESWTVKKTEHRRIDAFELWCWRRLLRVPWTARRSNQSILKISPGCSLEGMMLKLKL